MTYEKKAVVETPNFNIENHCGAESSIGIKHKEGIPLRTVSIDQRENQSAIPIRIGGIEFSNSGPNRLILKDWRTDDS